ncbi:MAG: GMC family oxidoreductase [Alteromonadaceae bacterium]|uniref:GMC family oxidoreductase n=1 Tax=Paraglaciecola chathamensis TaxID=368405 RepID=UPI000C5FA9CD|nr:choline dehydrogenase [Paraglaciecola agarilytica]MBN27377.1 GMC family oxidoreductase [Alteromonadaceae bacterium]|tara:strand:+ start:7067 stop:8689 length:1623 start_codon:yes stop_codon:yes gene_type:complete
MPDTPANTFDFIIVGAGSAGCTLAARLTEYKHCRVCLIEAGGKDSNPLIHIPFGLALLSRVKAINWNYNTLAQPHLNNRELYWPRGKTLGGSSSVNAMCYIRGVPEDYNDWAQQGAEGWDWDSVLPYFKKSEGYQRKADDYHGVNGPLCVDDLRFVNPMSQTFVDAARDVNLPISADFNGAQHEGLGIYQVTHKGGQRCSTAKSFLALAQDRPNFTLVTHALVEKVLIENNRTQGVAIQVNGQSQIIHAEKEVILSAGAINSPQLLMLSGVGPQQHLAEHGIEMKQNVAGVGQNLQDHLDAIVQYRCKTKESYAVALAKLPRYVQAALRYWRKRNDILSSNIAEAGGFVRSDFAADVPDIQFHFLPAILQDHGRQTALGYGFGLHICNLYPKSRGTITLASADPAQPAIIDPQYLSHPDDQKVMIDGIRKGRAILQSQGFAQYQGAEVLPGKDINSDEALLAFIKQHAETIYHPVGTCKMGADNDDMAVVDEKLNVRSVMGLRVADASVFPRLVGGNTNAPTIMVAERAADFIHQQYHLA